MTTRTVNQPVHITKMGFKKNLEAYPRRMEFQGRSYSFIDAGLRCLVRSGERIAQIVTVTDGDQQFRLRSDNHGGNWTLLSIITQG